MIRKNRRPTTLRRVGLAGQAIAMALAANALAQDNTEAPEQLKPTIVTGSYIPTAETVGAAPVETINSKAIEKIGAQDVLELVKKVSPVFAGNGNVGQEVNNGGAGESYVAIRNLPTLVLLNGRRMGNSSFSSGSLVDLNSIPMAAVDRVEILKDGASALYGSEAVGGVVNIITKKNYSGVEIGGRYGFATGDGTFTEKRASIVGGTATDKASFTAAAQWYSRDELKTTDRNNIAGLSVSELEKNGIDPYSVSYNSPSFPGKYSDTTGAYVLRSHPLLNSPEFSSLYDPSAPTTPPRIPNGSGGYKTFAGPTALSDYNNDPYWAANGMSSPFISDPGLLLNTTQFGTATIQGQERRNMFGSGEYDLFEKRMTVFADFLFADINSTGELAPSPVTGLGVKQSNINIPGDNVYNFLGTDLGPQGGVGGLPPGGPRIRSRFVDSGNRVFESQSDYYHFVGGLKGEFEGGWGYNAAYNYNKYNQIQYTHNAINGAALDLALQPSLNPAYAALGLSALPGAATPVPMYNIFGVPAGNIFNGPSVNSKETIDAIRTTLYQSGVSEEWDASGVITGTPFDLPGGKLGFAAGGAFGSESLFTDYDGLTKMGKVPGLNAALPTGGRRDNYNFFVETRIPITSPDMEIPVLRSLEVTAAGRYENFDPGGDAAVPKVGILWQPLDKQITLRGSYAESFVAPTTYQLYGGDQVSVPGLGVPTTSDPNAPVAGLQEYTTWKSNDELEPATATSWGGGIVFSPKCIEGFTVSLDYYHVDYTDQVFRVDEQTMVDSLNSEAGSSPWRDYFFKADGSQIAANSTAINQANDQDWGVLNVPLRNGADIVTDGLDITGSYLLKTEKTGNVLFYANANVLLSYEYSDPFAGGPYNYDGMYSDPNTIAPGGQGTLPDFQINTGFSWDIHDFTYTVNARYIPETEAWGGENFTTTGDGWTVDSWYSIDMQLAYEFGKTKVEGRKWYDGTRLAIGVNNVTDNEPPLIASAFEDNTDKSTYDIVGRFIYFEVSKKF